MEAGKSTVKPIITRKMLDMEAVMRAYKEIEPFDKGVTIGYMLKTIQEQAEKAETKVS